MIIVIVVMFYLLFLGVKMALLACLVFINISIINVPCLRELQICVICKQIHGSCTQCCKCSTYYHAMCASRAGYRMEVIYF